VHFGIAVRPVLPDDPALEPPLLLPPDEPDDPPDDPPDEPELDVVDVDGGDGLLTVRPWVYPWPFTTCGLVTGKFVAGPLEPPGP
jgi:hypothetical protein